MRRVGNVRLRWMVEALNLLPAVKSESSGFSSIGIIVPCGVTPEDKLHKIND